MSHAPGHSLVIRDLSEGDLPAAARLLARSMADNPLHRRVFGTHSGRLEALLEGTFARLLRRQLGAGGEVIGAFRDDVLVGVAAMVPPGRCQPTLPLKLGMLLLLARAGLLRRLPNIQRWLGTWARHDPPFDHWHLGPAAVERGSQGQGIGTALMRATCERLDRRQGVGYLETDKPENVRLYRRGGFEVVAGEPVLGVPNWFMRREPV